VSKCQDGLQKCIKNHGIHLVIPPSFLPSAIMYRQTNEMQEYGKLTEQTNRKLTLCSGVPCQGLTGSILVVLLTPNYSISSTGLFRANTRETDFTQPYYLQDPSMPARLAPYTMRRRPARRSPTSREIVVPASPSLSDFTLRSCSPRPS
jgi:hypothetical protein